MEFEEEYRQKLMTADQAAQLVKSGDWVDYGWTTGTEWMIMTVIPVIPPDLRPMVQLDGLEFPRRRLASMPLRSAIREDLNLIRVREFVMQTSMYVVLQVRPVRSNKKE